MGARISGHALEVLSALGGNFIRVSQSCVEVLAASITPSPTTVTGAGVSQDCLEVLFTTGGSGRVSNHLIEVLSADKSNIPSSGGGQTSFGYIG